MIAPIPVAGNGQGYACLKKPRDQLFWPSLGRTFHYALVVVPFGIGGSLALALLLDVHNQPKPAYHRLKALISGLRAE